MVAWNQFTFNSSQARDALQKVLADAKCPISGHQDWTIAFGYVEIKPVSTFPHFSNPYASRKVEITGGMAYHGGEKILGSGSTDSTFLSADDAAYPTVMATCKGCGYLALFNAVVLGLVPSSEPRVGDWGSSAENPLNG